MEGISLLSVSTGVAVAAAAAAAARPALRPDAALPAFVSSEWRWGKRRHHSRLRGVSLSNAEVGTRCLSS